MAIVHFLIYNPLPPPPEPEHLEDWTCVNSLVECMVNIEEICGHICVPRLLSRHYSHKPNKRILTLRELLF